MEPPCALADVKNERVNVWAAVQDPQSTRDHVANWLKTDARNVAINVTLLGGAFGRKSKPDFVLGNRGIIAPTTSAHTSSMES
ncbi:MAG: hypothetical protein Ct9H300mP8_10330 [Gammaproteobacteria bacterium]|nr:MAG: hypothetical protein Ct9H300mP8_10330 [Gammaproteobacteria bacterium]